MKHDWITPPCKEDCYGCMWCAGGLEMCKVCGAFEGATPDECPGKQMSYDFSDLVYKGIINFRDGNWYGECAEAMRHIHDVDNFMEEAGYFQNEHGKWEKFPVMGDK